MVFTSPKLSGFVLIAIPIIVLPLLAVRAARCAPARARAGHARRSQRLRRREPRRRADHAGLRRRKNRPANGLPRRSERLCGRPQARHQARAILTAFAIFLAFASVVGVLWLGAQDVLAGGMTGGSCRNSCFTPCSAPVRSASSRKYGARFPPPPAPPAASPKSCRSSRTSPRPRIPLPLPAAAARRNRLRARELRLSGRDADERSARPLFSRAPAAKQSPSSGRRAPANRPCSSC